MKSRITLIRLPKNDTGSGTATLSNSTGTKKTSNSKKGTGIASSLAYVKKYTKNQCTGFKADRDPAF
jgi:hypothetical protein